MKVLAIQHDAADPPAAAGEIIEQAGHELEVIRMDRGNAIPATAEADVLMTFGGGISLAGDDLPAWVAAEQDLIRTYFDEGRKIVGMCLGGQMIACALGGSVQRNHEVELGWHPVARVDSTGKSDMFPDQWMALHWHQDTFQIPPGATHLYRSEACENQAFMLDDRVYGFQFHLEANERTVRTFNKISPLRRRQGTFVQSEQRVLDGIDVYLAHQQNVLEQLMLSVLSWWPKSPAARLTSRDD